MQCSNLEVRENHAIVNLKSAFWGGRANWGPVPPTASSQILKCAQMMQFAQFSLISYLKIGNWSLRENDAMVHFDGGFFGVAAQFGARYHPPLADKNLEVRTNDALCAVFAHFLIEDRQLVAPDP